MTPFLLDDMSNFRLNLHIRGVAKQTEKQTMWLLRERELLQASSMAAAAPTHVDPVRPRTSGDPARGTPAIACGGGATNVRRSAPRRARFSDMTP
jgi:hypothetical protein